MELADSNWEMGAEATPVSRQGAKSARVKKQKRDLSRHHAVEM